MRVRVGGVIVQDDKMVLVHRVKEVEGGVREYYVIPGGGQEDGEDNITTLVREIDEELGVKVLEHDDNPIFSLEDDKGKHLYYLVNKIEGEVGTGCGPEFTSLEYSDHGTYLIEWVLIKDIKEGKIDLVPSEIKEQVIEYFSE